jgi:[ribosomal protein S5]-alanine N-acetyltransferase
MSTTLETPRLLVRAFQPDDLVDIHRILNEAFGVGDNPPDDLTERRSWLEWSRLSQEWLPKMHQPPYGDRAVVLKSKGQLIGSVGLVPCLSPYDQVPELRSGPTSSGFWTAEVGLFWAIDAAFRNQGYASEAAQALIDFAFSEMHLGRIIATTETDNLASQAVMRKLGMRICHNPLPTPPWLQVVGVLEID